MFTPVNLDTGFYVVQVRACVRVCPRVCEFVHVYVCVQSACLCARVCVCVCVSCGVLCVFMPIFLYLAFLCTSAALSNRQADQHHEPSGDLDADRQLLTIDRETVGICDLIL